MSEDIAIRVNKVYKDFKLPHARKNSLKSVFTSVFDFSRDKTVETQHALQDISFEIKKGEFFGIVGRNGSGKSTLLKMLAGIYQPTKGSVQVSGKLVPFIELGVGFNPELTGRENVYLNGALLGFDRKQIDDMYDAIVEFAELERFMDQKLKNYSSGMQVRLAFSMAIRADADILLIDEVLAVGDADFQRKCFEYFKNLKKNKKTVVFVSHDMEAVREYCDRAAFIEKNELKKIGDTYQIAEAYTRLFLEEGRSDGSLGKLNIENREGSGSVRVKDCKINKRVFTDDDTEIELTVKLASYSKTNQLMNGFAIKDSQGRFINGSHTWRLKENLNLKSGAEMSLVWKLPNIYEDGTYAVDLYVMDSNHEVLDRLKDVINFRIKKPLKTGCLIDVPVRIVIDAGKDQYVK